MMSKRHSALLKMYSNLQASHKIWRTAEEVWTSLGSAEIARGYILEYCIAAKVIESGGEKTFLQKQDFHSDVCAHFFDTGKEDCSCQVVMAFFLNIRMNLLE